MNRTVRIGMAGALLAVLAPLAAVAAPADEAAPAARQTEAQPDLMVRLTKLTGTGPDGRSHTLYANTTGAELPFSRLSRLAAVATPDGLPGGGYYALRAELASDFAVVDRAGRRVPSHFTVDGSPYHVALTGTLVVADSGVRAFGVAVDPGPTVHDGGWRRSHEHGEWGEEE